ncbi:MAG: FkbM family methyltransferase [Catalinimonas sp.]
MKETAKRALIKATSVVKSQAFWEAVHQLSLKQMNYGHSGHFQDTGELWAVKLVRTRFQREASITVFDVGANKGFYAATLSDLFGSQAQIHSFEPSRATYEQLLRNTHGRTNVLANHFGLSDEQHTQLLYTNTEGSGLASVYQRNLEHYDIAMAQTEEVRLTTIDDYCTEHAVERIHFLKLDVEGHELSVLKGAEGLLAAGRVDVIQFEFGGCNIDSKTYFRDFYHLLRGDFRIYRILRKGLREIRAYGETNEIFANANYLAIRRD